MKHGFLWETSINYILKDTRTLEEKNGKIGKKGKRKKINKFAFIFFNYFYQIPNLKKSLLEILLASDFENNKVWVREYG